MSARSKFIVSDELKEAFRSAGTSQTRYLVVLLEDEQLKLKSTVSRSGTWNKDFDKVKNELTEGQPTYIVFWKDQASERAVFTGRESGAKKEKSKVLLMLYNPDDAPVREKMVYASSWNTMKDLCGAGADEYQAATIDEFTHSTFSKLRQADDSLLSESEKQLRDTALADPVSMDEAKEAAGFNIIALSKGITSMPKVVQDSLNKAQAAKMNSFPKRVKNFEESSNAGGSVRAAAGSVAATRNTFAGGSGGSVRGPSASVANSRNTIGGGSVKEPSSSVTSSSNAASSNAPADFAADEDGEPCVKPSQMKTWPPQKVAD